MISDRHQGRGSGHRLSRAGGDARDGRTFVLESLDSDVVADDTNRTWDAFVRTLPPAS
ncbi:hypothetical protein AB0G64_05695 [Streptomyces longwoodensis]|uniref:hypothetical protein n=1 Tax=Streptomyces longwoodensis TaxID=68231 RepID=UPI0034035A58